MADGTLVLNKLLDRLMQGLLNGPAMNCRPHNSRQRVDLASLGKLDGVDPQALLSAVLGGEETYKLVIKTPKAAPRKHFGEKSADKPAEKPAEKPTDKPADKTSDDAVDLTKMLQKLRTMTDDARTYTQDTGVHVLSIGFPLLTMPPGTLGKEMSRRVIAPIAFIPVEMSVTRGVSTTVEIRCYGQGLDRVVPNMALFAWLEQLVKKEGLTREFEDEHGTKPLREICMLVAAAAKALELPIPGFVPKGHDASTGEDAPDLKFLEDFKLATAPKSDEGKDAAEILPAAVMGLFPMANQGLIQDMKAYAAGEEPAGPMASFVRANLALDTPVAAREADQPPPIPDAVPLPTTVQLVADADPCQKQVVRLSQNTQGVVVHGPPGTGKSQTIVNMIGDSLARGQRVLFVCDKRTALDVVLNRLSFVGVGGLCAVVHDPQQDQKDFYRSVREQLDALVETKPKPPSEKDIANLESELNRIHSELSTYHKAVMHAPAGEASFSQKVGQWFGLPDVGSDMPAELATLNADTLGAQATTLRELFDRAAASDYKSNPWAGVATTDVAGVLSRPVSEIQSAASAWIPLAQKLDATLLSGTPAFDAGDLAAQVAPRTAAGKLLAQIVAKVPVEMRAKWSKLDAADTQRMVSRLADAGPMLERVNATPLDTSLAATAKSLNLGPADLARQSQQLQAYIESAGGFLGALAFGRKRDATAVLQPFGLPLDAASATKLKAFIDALRDRTVLSFLVNELNGTPSADNAALPDDALNQSAGGYVAFGQLLQTLGNSGLRSTVLAALPEDAAAPALAAALAQSGPRVEAAGALLAAMTASKLVSSPAPIADLVRGGAAVLPRISAMSEEIETLENVVRIEKTLADLGPATPAVRKLLASGVDASGALSAIAKKSLEKSIRETLAANASLTSVDPQRIQTGLDRIAELDKQRQAFTKERIMGFWQTRARDRLVKQSGASGLSPQGADLKRRFTMTGKNAMRLRKVLQLGAGIEGGDPLFDLRPVWMASPETVAQLFARKPIFDVVIFDEASQCRLEEALPVLARARRVVIAGDEKQLPPTRFFESAGALEEDANDAQSSQELFEKQQSQVEDLLTAALQLQVQEAYLDVHYRSKNADLIEFSNQYFYRSRLQPIPTHPGKLGTVPPVRLVRADGVYEASVNQKEAAKVVEVVRELLALPRPPSIGVACMNVQQRDEIADALDDAASADAEFGKKLDEARSRMGKGSFEGLFVKNLENVQGDERDHMIISTTYGPDKAGKFFRRFGPLQQQGGGRRLNVLVTRAREMVHLITSVPAGEYRALPKVPEGSAATGGWLLYAYLKYAEELIEKYAKTSQVAQAAGAIELQNADDPCELARSLAGRLLADGKLGSIVNWGNEGFCVDLTPKQSDGSLPLGIVIDGTRFKSVDDPIAWDLFRMNILKAQGWNLQRIWTPHFFRDPAGALKKVLGSV